MNYVRANKWEYLELMSKDSSTRIWNVLEEMSFPREGAMKSRIGVVYEQVPRIRTEVFFTSSLAKYNADITIV